MTLPQHLPKLVRQVVLVDVVVDNVQPGDDPPWREENQGQQQVHGPTCFQIGLFQRAQPASKLASVKGIGRSWLCMRFTACNMYYILNKLLI